MTKYIIAVLIFAGCSSNDIGKPQTQSFLKCIDGNLYSIIEYRSYELVEENGCKDGNIELESK